MQTYDALVVGGGPAGSACAGALTAAGLKTAVLDREAFPRVKLCAGWVTPDVLDALRFDVNAYPYRFNTFDHLVVHCKGMTVRVRTLQHSIRRYEFDHFLLENSQADSITHEVKKIEKKNGTYSIDDVWRSKYLIGAGGTRCPVYRTVFRGIAARSKELQIVAYEQEFPYAWRDARCHLWFFERGLPGYAWYVPKANGYLNCGVGAMAEKLKDRHEDIRLHWRYFVHTLQNRGLVNGFDFTPRGYSYYLCGKAATIQRDNAYLIGDAAGLATADLGEGIGPAVKSGQRAALAIANDTEYTLDGIETTSADRIVHAPLLRGLVKAAQAWRGRDAG